MKIFILSKIKKNFIFFELGKAKKNIVKYICPQNSFFGQVPKLKVWTLKDFIKSAGSTVNIILNIYRLDSHR